MQDDLDRCIWSLVIPYAIPTTSLFCVCKRFNKIASSVHVPNADSLFVAHCKSSVQSVIKCLQYISVPDAKNVFWKSARYHRSNMSVDIGIFTAMFSQFQMTGINLLESALSTLCLPLCVHLLRSTSSIKEDIAVKITRKYHDWPIIAATMAEYCDTPTICHVDLMKAACLHGHFSVVTSLLSRYPTNVSWRVDSYYKSIAITNGHDHILEQFIHINVADISDTTIYQAIKRGHYRIIKILLDTGFFTDPVCIGGYIEQAVSHGRRDIAILFLEMPHECGDNNYIHSALRAGYPELAIDLLQYVKLDRKDWIDLIGLCITYRYKEVISVINNTITLTQQELAMVECLYRIHGME